MGDVTRWQTVDSDRMAVLYHHVVEMGHTVRVRPMSDKFVEVECIDQNSSMPCGELTAGGDAWWDHWDFTDSYVDHIQRHLKSAEELNGI